MKLLTTADEDFVALEKKFSSVKRYGLDYETIPKVPQRTKPLQKVHSLQHDLLQVLGIGYGFEDGTKTYVPLRHKYGEGGVINAPMEKALHFHDKVLGDADLEMFAHNLKFEYLVSRSLGSTPKNKLRCSQIAQWMVGRSLDKGRGLKLKPAAKYFLKCNMKSFDDIVVKGMSADDVLPRVMGAYCADDALRCLQLGLHFFPELEKYGLMRLYTDLDMRFVPVLVHMQECGIGLEHDNLLRLSTTLSAEMDVLDTEFENLVGVGISKNAQISRRLYEELEWWPTKDIPKGVSGVYSISKPNLELVEQMLEPDCAPMHALKLKQRYQEIATISSTFTHSLIEKATLHEDGRVRGSFNQTGTETSRLSSAGPNMQNIPSRTAHGAEIRDAFIAEPGWSVCVADYSQADLVMMAHLSQDPMLLKAYRTGADLHQQTADECTEVAGIEVSRPTGKVTNLGLIYEMTAEKLAEQLGVEVRVAEVIHRAWHQVYVLVGSYHTRMHKFAREHGFVRTIAGRIRFLPDINSGNWGRRSRSERMASNTPDQGSVAEVIKIAMRNLVEEWAARGILYDYYTKEGKAKLALQVHDELVCELKNGFEEEGMADIRRHLEQAVELRVPMTAQPGVGRSWNAAKNDVKRREKLAEEAKKTVDVAMKAELMRQVMAVD